jgi:hypothetical protein
VKIANQKTGVISTPKAGGMLPLTNRRSGSDGHATIAHGNSFRFVSGYHEATTRQSCEKRKVKTKLNETKRQEKRSMCQSSDQRHTESAQGIIFSKMSPTMANDMKLRNGPKTNAVGCTQASVSASIMADEAEISGPTLAAASTREGSIMDRDIEGCGMEI